MKKLGLFTGLAMIALASTAYAESPVANMCTGGKAGNYFYAGKTIAGNAQGGLSINVMETQGSIDNLKRLERGECDFAIVQQDALNIYKSDNPSSGMTLETLTSLYKEYAHLVCNKDIGGDSITDLTPKNKILTGPLGSGSYVTWRGFATADKEYAQIATGPETGPVALLKIKGGTEAQCILFVTGLNSAPIKELDKNSAGKLTLMEIDDGSLDNLKDEKGEKIYKFAKIPSGMYPKLTGNSFSDWDTVTVDAIVVVNTNWINNNPSGFGTLAEALVASENSIRQHMGQ